MWIETATCGVTVLADVVRAVFEPVVAVPEVASAASPIGSDVSAIGRGATADWIRGAVREFVNGFKV